VQAADDSVQRTPELLPVLKEAGVVDSGGLGFFYILEGMLRAAYRLPLDKPLAAVQPLSAISIQEAREAVEPDQDWEVVIDFQPKSLFDIQAFYGQLEKMGTSIQVGEGDGMYRMHIHVPDKTEYEPIEYVKSLGNITRVSMENLMAQMEEEEDGIHHLRLASVESGTNAAVTVAPGMGIARVFASLGAAAIIEGGQTMNPSTKEILDAFENLPTNKIIILPNNKNILLAARQAAELTVKKIAVIPSVSVPQGVSALLALDPNGDFKTTCQAMTKAIDEVQSAEITVATRSVEIDGVGVEEGQVIGIVNGRLAVAGDNLEQVLLDTLVTMKASEGELITLYYGEDLTAMQANQLADRVRENYPQQEVEVIEGGQPHYQLILSAE
jgi:DAK2 domain fusion protein YloV